MQCPECGAEFFYSSDYYAHLEIHEIPPTVYVDNVYVLIGGLCAAAFGLYMILPPKELDVCQE